MTLTTSAVSPAIAEATEMYNRMTTVRNVLAPDLSDQELQLFALVAQRSGLDPFAKQIHAIKRNNRVTFQTGIDGYRATAARTGEYGGSDEPEYGPIVGAPLEHPEWARVTVYRLANGQRWAQSATAWWAEFYPGDAQGHMWKKMPRNQLAKCAEALALRKAFPYVLADLYTTDEMDQAGPPENAAVVEAEAQPTARERIAARRVALEGGEVRIVADPDVEPVVVGVAETETSAGGLSKEQFTVALRENRIAPEFALARSRELFPRGDAETLTDEQRAQLLADLTTP